MSEPPSDDFDQKLAALAEDFRRSLAATRLEIEGVWSDALAGNEAARAKLLVLVHRLSGSAASFGQPVVAAAAEHLDRDLRASKLTAPHAELMSELDRALIEASAMKP